jgi:DNA integrity scanning protein DisA with diadenylate cyclase activity
VWDLLRNHATTQKVEKGIRAEVVRSIYRAALDVSFRRSGGLFVLLKNQNNIRELVAEGDAIGDTPKKGNRAHVHVEFDKTVRGKTMEQIPRPVLAEIAGLDGAIVLNNSGRMLAYAAVLQTPKRRKLKPSEGSRTKAAIAASRYGIAVKVSSDGDITFYREGNPYLKI